MTLNAQQFSAACEALEDILSFEHPADVVLSSYFRQNRQIGGRDRGEIAEAVYGVVRRLRSIDRYLETFPMPLPKGMESTDKVRVNQGPKARQRLLVWLSQIQRTALRDMELYGKPREMSWLAGLDKDKLPEATLGEELDLPDWLCERLLAQGYDEESLRNLAFAMNRPAPLDLRVNVAKASREEALGRLKNEGLHPDVGSLSPFALRLHHKQSIMRSQTFKDGVIEVQDEGSQLLGLLVGPKRGEMVVDFCAGAGGKTLLLGMLMRSTGRLYAFDVSEKRLSKLKPRAARAGLSNIHPVVINSENDTRVKRLAGKCDRVLVDAPCSGLGTLRRNPDLKWRQSPQSVEELIGKQRSILQSASRMVKVGGRVVYATCSILREENQTIIEEFLAANPNFELENASQILAKACETYPAQEEPWLQLNPVTHQTDGFFAAAFVRRS